MTISLVLASSVRSKALAQQGVTMARQSRSSSLARSSALMMRPRAIQASTAQNWMVPLVAGGFGCFSTLPSTTTSCESLATRGIPSDSEMAQVYARALAKARRQQQQNKGWLSYCRRALRMLIRAAKLALTLSPVMALYPFWKLLHTKDESVDVHDMALVHDANANAGALSWYLELCLTCVEWSGAAVIKLCQWAGSRPDMFGHDFCAVFSRLQDSTTPHAWRHTERMLRQAYGDNWHERITIRHQNKSILGSGCIGQVYKGEVLNQQSGKPMPVAVKGGYWQFRTCTKCCGPEKEESRVKGMIINQSATNPSFLFCTVLHPNVENAIDADLDLMRLAVRIIQRLPWDIFRHLKWLNLEGFVEEFADLLKLQLDCRVEAANLEQFNRNFGNSEHVEFPRLIDGYAPSKNVLIESFCEGVPVIQFAKEHRDQQELLSKMCFAAIEAVCKMIFIDNFMHGDLHPGNVFIDAKRKKIVLFDVGIVATYTEADHENIVDILAALIRRKGRLAGRLMIDSSNRLLRESNDHAIDEELFIDKIEAMNKKATQADYLMEHLGSYITTICDAAACHHVLMNEAFISSALAVKIQEGIAIALDPSIQVYDVAIPVIYESEKQRGIVKAKDKAQQLMGGLGNMFKRQTDKASSIATSAR